MNGKRMEHKRIRRVSIDKFYEIVTGEKVAFKKLCDALPSVIEDVVKESSNSNIENFVLSELKAIHPNILDSLYILAFEKYEGFQRLSNNV